MSKSCFKHACKSVCWWDVWRWASGWTRRRKLFSTLLQEEFHHFYVALVDGQSYWSLVLVILRVNVETIIVQKQLDNLRHVSTFDSKVQRASLNGEVVVEEFCEDSTVSSNDFRASVSPVLQAIVRNGIRCWLVWGLLIWNIIVNYWVPLYMKLIICLNNNVEESYLFKLL